MLQVNQDGSTFRGFMGDYSLKLLQGSNVLGEMEFKLEDDLEIVCDGNVSIVLCS